MTRGSARVYDLSKRCNSSGGSLPGFRMGIKGHYLVQLSAYLLKTPAEDIMNKQAPQGTAIEAAVLAPRRMDLYSPPSGH
jgi:hypothetical protein